MPRTARSPEFLALQRRQLAAQLGDTRIAPAPPDGWIRTIRTALGMSAAQFGKRLGISAQGALDLERREKNGSITVAKLRHAAAALNCEVTLAWVPTLSFDETMREQAEKKARAEHDSVVHTMRLEAQEEGVQKALKKSRASEAWLTTRLAKLWD
jgi:predicted DNA-binding mobile mystery protein A